MPKVYHVKRARKTNKKLGIKKGKPYWWWKRRSPGSIQGYKVISLSPPRPSQLTGSPFLQEIYSLREQLEDLSKDAYDAQDVQNLVDALRDITEQVNDLAQEQRDKVDNLPESLQSSPTAELLEQRTDQCETLAQELDGAADELELLLDDDSADSFDVSLILASISWDVEC